MTLRNLDRWVRGMRDGMAGLKKPQAAEVGRPSASGAGQRRLRRSRALHFGCANSSRRLKLWHELICCQNPPALIASRWASRL